MLKGDICSEFCDYELYFQENLKTIEKMIYHVQNYLSVQDFYLKIQDEDERMEMVMVFVGSLLVNNMLTMPKGQITVTEEQQEIIAKISGDILVIIYYLSLESKGIVKRRKNSDWEFTKLGKACGEQLLKEKAR